MRISENAVATDFIYKNETAIVPLAGNETGACIMGLERSDWYIIQIFQEQVNNMMVANANRIGIVLAVFLVVILEVLLLLTYLILNGSRLETKKALIKAEAASKAKTDFLFSMSHDIRTPMNAIMGFLHLLDEQQEEPTRRKEYIHKMADSSELLLSIINNVLEMSQIEGGEVSMRLTEIPSDQEGIAVFKTEIEDNGIGITEEFMPHLFERFQGSRTQRTARLPEPDLEWRL